MGMKTETKPYVAYYEREVARYWELKKDKQKWNKLSRSEKCEISRRINPLLAEAAKVSKWMGN